MHPIWWTLLVLVAVGAVLAVYAVLIEPFDLRVTTLDVALADLDPAFDGYTISVLADVHHSPWTPMAHLRRIVEASNRADPDLVALLGDYSTSFDWLRRLSLRFYRRMLPRMTPVLTTLTHRDGVVGLLGNHDHWADDELVVRWLASLGVRVLDNSCVTIRRGDAQLLIGGVADADEGQVDPFGGCARGPAGVPTVVLSHSPDGILDFDRSRRIDLVLAGHTHGGQVIVPFYGAPITVSKICGRRTASGWIPNSVAPLYVSRGAGSQIPLRFGCPPEVVIVRLRTARSEVQGPRSEGRA